MISYKILILGTLGGILVKLFRKKLTFISVLVLISAIIFPSFTALAADASYKFSAIDLKLKVPEELICFTQTTTGNNAYLKDIGAQDANEVQNSMKASNIYLEAFSKDLSYEIAVVGMKAGSSLSNLDELDENQLSSMFLQYIDSENAKQEDGLTETMTGKAIDIINDRPYFRTEVTSVSDEKQTIYTRKYYTVARGYIYMYSLQSKDNEITDEMINDILIQHNILPLRNLSLKMVYLQKHFLLFLRLPFLLLFLLQYICL